MAEVCVTKKKRSRRLRSLAELPTKVRESDFDYVPIECGGCEHVPRFFRFRGSWYDTHQFELIATLGLDIRHALTEYHAVQTESAFSAVLIKHHFDDDTVTVAYAHW